MFKKIIKEQDTIHFIIHPEFARDEHEKFEEYYTELHSFFSNLETSFIETNCFLIKTEHDTDFASLIPQKNQLTSYTHLDGQASGNIGAEDWPGFKNIANTIKDKKIVFHGSYLGFCVRGFALQLATYYYLDEIIAKETFTPNSAADHREQEKRLRQTKLRDELLAENFSQNILQNKFSYGNVLGLYSTDLVSKSPANNRIATDFDWAKYFMDVQMTNENTKIFF